MVMFSVNEDCVQCGLCAELCIARIIDFKKGQDPSVAPEAEKNCIRCGQCVCFCPTEACALNFQHDRQAVAADLMPRPESAETFLRSRRSIRRYKEEPVDEAAVRRILESARYAPSAVNTQPVRWILTQSRAETKKLGGLTAAAFKKMVQAKPDSPEAQRLAGVAAVWDKGQDIIFRGAPQLAIAVVNKNYRWPEDAVMALTYFELAAHALGVGCCWAGFFTSAARQSPEIQKILGLKEEEMVVGGQMFGYPRGLHLPHLYPPRKELDLTFI